MNSLEEIASCIGGAQNIALFCHTNPDGDALGSMLAMYVALTKMGKNVGAYCDSPVPKKYECLACADKISFPQKTAAELAISVDCADIDRLGQAQKAFLRAQKRIAIDHHSSFEAFANINYVDATASACAEIIYMLLEKAGGLNSDVAALLFGAIVTDSGCFQYSSVTKRTHEIACKLLDFDFDASKVIYDVFAKTDAHRFALKTRALSAAKFFCDDRIALIRFTDEDFKATGTTQCDTEGIVSELIDIDSVLIAISVAEVGAHSFKVSIRTKDCVNAAKLASVFGGGGHPNAAGCRANGFIEDVLDRLIRIAETFLP